MSGIGGEAAVAKGMQIRGEVYNLGLMHWKAYEELLTPFLIPYIRRGRDRIIILVRNIRSFPILKANALPAIPSDYRYLVKKNNVRLLRLEIVVIIQGLAMN